MDGKVHHFSAGGLYNGLVLLTDDETRSHWDHVTGEAVHGALRGKKLENWYVETTTVAAALAARPNLSYSRGRQTWIGRLMQWMPIYSDGGWMPWGFQQTMGAPDARREKMDRGLGVVEAGTARYYPVQDLTALQATEAAPLVDTLGTRELRIWLGTADKVPHARWSDGGIPFQLFTRWYGFSYTYPACEVFGAD